MQPHHSEQPPPNQPPYAPNQPHYLQVGRSEAAVTATNQKAQRDIAFGVVWLVVGLLITGITYASAMPVYVVAFGPVLYGIFKIIRGAIALNRQ
jgi:hypothetical protein